MSRENHAAAVNGALGAADELIAQLYAAKGKADELFNAVIDAVGQETRSETAATARHTVALLSDEHASKIVEAISTAELVKTSLNDYQAGW